MADSEQKMALDACDGAFKDGIAKSVAAFQESLIGASSDLDKQQATQRLQNAMEVFKEALATSKSVAVQVFPGA